LIRLKARLQVSILKKINIIIWIVLLSFVYVNHADSQQIGNNEAPGNHSALKKLSPMKTPAFNGSRVIVRLKKNSPDKGQSNHKYNKLLKLGNPAIIQRLKQRTEERQATILQALEKNRRSLTKRSWIPFLRRQAKNPAPPLKSRSLWLANSIAVTVTKKDLEELKKNPNVEEIVENSILSVSPIGLGTDENPLEGEELWNHTLIGLEAARELGLDGTGIRIGQLDTGINPNLPDMAGKLVAWAEFDWNGEIINSQPHETHASGHGTHVASVIVGDTTGVAPGAELLAALVLPGGYGTLEQVLAGMQWVIDPDGDPETDDGAQIVNMSLGMRGTSQVLREAVMNMVASGVLPVCAIGNSGPGTTYSPGNVPEAVGVGAVNEYDNSLIFSSGGEVCWGDLCIIKPDITAPGDHVLGINQVGDYQTMSGTSLAAPHVAGAAALLMQYNPLLNMSELKTFLISSSKDLGNPGIDCSFGWGRLDAASAIYFFDYYDERFNAADLILEETRNLSDTYKYHAYNVFFSNGADDFNNDESSVFRMIVNQEEMAINTAGIGDVDGDGTNDLVVTEVKPDDDGMFTINYKVALSLNSAPFSGKIKTWYSYTSAFPETYEVIGLADVNGDKKSDLVIVERKIGLIQQINVFALLSDETFFYRNSTENWTSLFCNRSYNFNFLLGDVNGDDKSDLVLVKSYKNNIPRFPVYYYIYPSSGETFESSSCWLIIRGKTVKFKTLADFNGDGLDDLLLLTDTSSVIPDIFSANVYISNGISRFNDSVEWARIDLRGYNYSINTGDANGDGTDDLILGRFDQYNNSLIFNLWPADKFNEEFYQGAETEIIPGPRSEPENIKITGVLNMGLGNWQK
jgi:hypothetical protein